MHARQVERFWGSIHKDECWEWNGERDRDGYGIFRAGNNRYLAHRLVHTLLAQPIPHGAMVLHACDNRHCVNPAHHRLGTHAENMREMAARGRAARLCGEHNGRAKLTAAEVVGIRNSVMGHNPVARAVGVHEREVRRIRRGERWRHL